MDSSSPDVTNVHGHKEVMDKKRNAPKNTKTISKSYLKQFASFQSTGEEQNDVSENGSDIDVTLKKYPLGFFVSKSVQITASDDRKKVFLYNVNLAEQIFLTLHLPTSSPFSKLFSNWMMIVIIISCVFFVISSDPDVKSIPSSCDSPVCENDPMLCPGETLCEPVEVSKARCYMYATFFITILIWSLI